MHDTPDRMFKDDVAISNMLSVFGIARRDRGGGGSPP